MSSHRHSKEVPIQRDMFWYYLRVGERCRKMLQARRYDKVQEDLDFGAWGRMAATARAPYLGSRLP